MSALQRAVLKVLWAVSLGLPIAGLSAELWLVLERRAVQRDAEEYKRKHPNVFDADFPRGAEGRALWKTPWSAYRPLAHVELDLAGEPYVIQINSRGFRTKEFEEKPPGTLRVVCIGGSTTFQGRTNLETYPALLETSLHGMDPSAEIEVLNLGISGISSDYWLRKREELFRVEPDVVVQYEGVNDIIWEELPRYAEAHPWKQRLYKSLLFQRLFPVDALAFDRYAAWTIDNQARMALLCRRHGARYIAGSFAAPDYHRARPEFRDYLDVNVTEWTARSMRLTHYQDYARILARHNQLFEEAVRMGRFDGAMVSSKLSDPGVFTDICHMDQAGIAQLAEAFLPEVAAAVEAKRKR